MKKIYSSPKEKRRAYYLKHGERWRAAVKTKRKANPERYRQYDRRVQWKRHYRLTEAQVFAMLAAQNGCCAICNNKLEIGRNLHVDHDHQTGQVRGLLCNLCNGGLGLFCDDLSRLSSAIRYLTDRAIVS